MKKWNGSKWIRPEKRKQIYTRDNHTCLYCGDSIYTDAEMILTLDHVTPRELGGDNDASNLVTACKTCNSAKRALRVSAFIQVLSDHGVDTTRTAKNIRNATRRNLPKKGSN